VIFYNRKLLPQHIEENENTIKSYAPYLTHYPQASDRVSIFHEGFNVLEAQRQGFFCPCFCLVLVIKLKSINNNFNSMINLFKKLTNWTIHNFLWIAGTYVKIFVIIALINLFVENPFQEQIGKACLYMILGTIGMGINVLVHLSARSETKTIHVKSRPNRFW